MTIKEGPFPTPNRTGDIPLEEAIQSRRSVRSYQSTPIEFSLLGQILWAAQGLRDPRGYRNAPSAGALYPLELYVVSQEGIFHYQINQHALKRDREGDFRSSLMQAALDQEFILQAPLTIVITAVPSRTISKYGEVRSPRYVDFEVGHVAQNVMLQASVMGLGSVPVGAFRDEEVARILELDQDSIPLYLIPIGYPAEG